MPLVSKFDLLLYNATEELLEKFRSITYWVVKLQLVKVRKLDVCGSLVLSNSVTFILKYLYNN